MACIDLDAGAGIRLYKVGIIVTAITTSNVYPGCTVELGSNNTALVIVRHLRYRVHSALTHLMSGLTVGDAGEFLLDLGGALFLLYGTVPWGALAHLCRP